MRYQKDQKDKTRQQILDAAAKVFRRHGFQAGSVDIVMKEAGLTAGGFYAHFESKAALFAEAILGTLAKGKVLYGKDTPELKGADRVRSVAGKYLSPLHREHIDRGCVLPPLLADLPRQEESVRSEFQKVLAEVASALQVSATEKRDQESSEDRAAGPDEGWAVLAMLVGGMSLARAVADKDLSDRILLACRGLLDRSLGDSTAEPETSSPNRSRPAPGSASPSPTPAPPSRRRKSP